MHIVYWLDVQSIAILRLDEGYLFRLYTREYSEAERRTQNVFIINSCLACEPASRIILPAFFIA